MLSWQPKSHAVIKLGLGPQQFQKADANASDLDVGLPLSMAVGAYLTIYDRGIGHAIEIIALDADGNALVHYDSDEYDEPLADAWIEERKIKQAKRVTSKAKNAGVRWNRSYAQATPRTQRAVTVHPPEDDNVPEWTTGERPEPSSAGYWTYGDDDKPVRVEKCGRRHLFSPFETAVCPGPSHSH